MRWTVDQACGILQKIVFRARLSWAEGPCRHIKLGPRPEAAKILVVAVLVLVLQGADALAAQKPDNGSSYLKNQG
jgi:hypothetical protein